MPLGLSLESDARASWNAEVLGKCDTWTLRHSGHSPCSGLVEQNCEGLRFEHHGSLGKNAVTVCGYGSSHESA